MCVTLAFSRASGCSQSNSSSVSTVTSSSGRCWAGKRIGALGGVNMASPRLHDGLEEILQLAELVGARQPVARLDRQRCHAAGARLLVEPFLQRAGDDVRVLADEAEMAGADDVGYGALRIAEREDGAAGTRVF